MGLNVRHAFKDFTLPQPPLQHVKFAAKLVLNVPQPQPVTAANPVSGLIQTFVKTVHYPTVTVELAMALHATRVFQDITLTQL